MADAIALIDDLFFLAKVHETAKHTGVTLETAATGEQLLKAAAASPAALILVDLNARQGALDAVERLCAANGAASGHRQPAARDCVSIPCADGFGGTRARSGMQGRDAAIQVHAKSRRNIARSEIVMSWVKNSGTGFSLSGFLSRLAKSKSRQAEALSHYRRSQLIALHSSDQDARAQPAANHRRIPKRRFPTRLSAACRQDSPAFANSLTADNATAFRALPGAQRTAMMKRFVLLEEPGRVLLSTSSNGQKIVRCESPSFTTEMRLGETRVRENLAYVPMEIPIPGEDPRKITFGLVREGGNWKLLSVGLILLDVPAMAKQWEQADLDASEDAAIADLRSVAAALETYRRAYGKLPDTLASLGPAPPNGVSPEAAGLLDADLAAGNKDGYTIRYTHYTRSRRPAGGRRE